MYIATVVHVQYNARTLTAHCVPWGGGRDVEDVFIGKQGLSVAEYKFLLVLAVKTELAAWWF